MSSQAEALRALGYSVKDLKGIFEKQEELRPELKAYLDTAAGFPAVRHPRLYSVPHFEQTNAWLNLRYEILQKAFEKAQAEKDHDAMLSLTERPFRLEVFYNLIADECEPRKYWRLLGELYTDCENIHQNANIWEELLFGGYVKVLNKTFMGAQNAKLFKELPNEMTIYRGTQTEYWQGFSWSLSKDKARWFANRYERSSNHPMLTTAKVNKEDILGYFDGRNEKEVVCHFNNAHVISHESLK